MPEHAEKITNIEIHNIKGIGSASIPCDFFPNKPNFLLAPNGTGKTSIATGFNALNNNRLNLKKTDYHINEDGKQLDDSESSVSITAQINGVEQSFIADREHNDISSDFDVHVIRSGRYAKASTRRINGFSTATAAIRVPDITIAKVEKKCVIPYRFTDIKKNYPKPLRQKIINLSDYLKCDAKNYVFIYNIINIKLKKYTDKGRFSKLKKQFFDTYSEFLKGRKDISSLHLSITALLSAFDNIQTLNDFLSNKISQGSNNNTEYEAILTLNSIQLYDFYITTKSDFASAIKWLHYKLLKETTKKRIHYPNINDHNKMSLIEHNGLLMLQLPEQRFVSNGELDIVNLIGQFAAIDIDTRKPNIIVLIDEVFDYLDDANLLIAQYFILRMIHDCKNKGKNLFPIILTHLHPELMKSYTFKIKHVSIFSRQQSYKNASYFTNLITRRDQCKRNDRSIYNQISSYFLHYNPQWQLQQNTGSYLLTEIKMPHSLLNQEEYYQHCDTVLKNYCSNRSVKDPLLLCCALRITLERSIFQQLYSEQQQEDFIDTNETIDKFNYAIDKHVDVPDIYFLLSSIYNPAMHIKRQDDTTLIYQKIDNNFIRSIIKETCLTLLKQ